MIAASACSIFARSTSGANGLVPSANQRLDVWQFAAVVQGEYRLLNGDLEIGGEVGYASGGATRPGICHPPPT